MPDKETLERAQEDKREGKSPTTQAGEFVREEIHHIRKGKHGARSTKQAIAIGLSQARRAGVDLPPPAKGKTTERTRKSAERAYARGHGAPAKSKPSPKRSRAIGGAPAAAKANRPPPMRRFPGRPTPPPANARPANDLPRPTKQ